MTCRLTTTKHDKWKKRPKFLKYYTKSMNYKIKNGHDKNLKKLLLFYIF